MQVRSKSLLTVWALTLIIMFGYVANIYRLFAYNDFASPYKTEAVRMFGIAFAPVGVVLGYINVEG